MKLLRYGSPGEEKPGLLDAQGQLRDLSHHLPDLRGDALHPERLRELAGMNADSLPLVSGAPRIGPCVGGVGKIVCVGLNYADHAAESNMALPEEPLLFLKATTALCGPNDPVEMPPGSHKLDWEVELGVVMGRRAKRIDASEAMSHVAGFCVFNDVSERSFQLERGGSWDKGKSSDTFAPLGPWLVTTDEMPDPSQLALWVEVDGVRRQSGNTQTMIFDVPTLVSYISQFMTLEPGDVIATGTPPGVGMGMKPEPQFLRLGQTMRTGIAGLGEQCQRVVQAIS